MEKTRDESAGTQPEHIISIDTSATTTVESTPNITRCNTPVPLPHECPDSLQPSPLAERLCPHVQWGLLQSDPGVFRHWMKEFGASGLDFREVLTLDDLLVFHEHHPLAFIYCFPMDPEDPSRDRRGQGNPKCPETMFFANQVLNNTCATQAAMHALLNIENLPEDATLGRLLPYFSDFTKGMAPSVKGMTIASTPWLLAGHNETVSLPFISEIFPKAAEPPTPPPANKRKKSRKNKWQDSDDELNIDDYERPITLSDRAFHYITFVPHKGIVWELDGLQKEPISHGPIASGAPWYELALKGIQKHMRRLQDVRFSILMIVADPLPRWEKKLEIARDRRRLYMDLLTKIEQSNCQSKREALNNVGKKTKQLDEIVESLKLKILDEKRDRQTSEIYVQRIRSNYLWFIAEMIGSLWATVPPQPTSALAENTGDVRDETTKPAGVGPSLAECTGDETPKPATYEQPASM